jgi:hypothetical protein
MESNHDRVLEPWQVLALQTRTGLRRAQPADVDPRNRDPVRDLVALAVVIRIQRAGAEHQYANHDSREDDERSFPHRY